jgi:hypothetical protein
MLKMICARLGRAESWVKRTMHEDRNLSAMSARDIGLVTQIIWPTGWTGARS